MRKKLPLFFLFNLSIAGIIFLPGCRKEDTATNTIASTIADVSDPLLAEARSYFEATQSTGPNTAARNNNQYALTSMPRMVEWGKAVIKNMSAGAAVYVPIQYEKNVYQMSSFGGNRLYGINTMQFIMLYKDKQAAFHTEWITCFPDSNAYAAHPGFSGIKLVQDWQGNFIKEYKYTAGKPNRILTAKKLKNISQGNGSNGTGNDAIVEVCYYSTGINYYEREEDGYYWEVPLGCDDYFIDDAGSSGTGGNNGNTGSAGNTGPTSNDYNGANAGAPADGNGYPSITIAGGNNIIGNIHDYDKCFDNIAGSTRQYTVTVCVAQPEPGVRTAWGAVGVGSSAVGNIVAVGHSFLILTESGANGTITRNVGFYPQNAVTPISPSSLGQLNNDAEHQYNISLTLSVDNSQFFQILNYIMTSKDNANLYNLNSYNCTTFVLDALASAGIDLPATKDGWPGGYGNNPGDFGEDIREMNLQPGMVRSIRETAHPNNGICY